MPTTQPAETTWYCQTLLITGGYAFSLVLGHFTASWAVKRLWQIATPEHKDIHTTGWLAVWHGVAERFIYTSTVLLGRPDGIAVWLAYKAVMRWQIGSEDRRHIPGSAIYVVGTVISLTFGVVGGMIAQRKFAL